YAVLRPPMLKSEAWVVLPPSSAGGESVGTQLVGTQVVIAHSDDVLKGALPKIHTATSLEALRDQVDAKARTAAIVAIIAKDKNASQAQNIAEAVDQSYVAY